MISASLSSFFTKRSKKSLSAADSHGAKQVHSYMCASAIEIAAATRHADANNLHLSLFSVLEQMQLTANDLIHCKA